MNHLIAYQDLNFAENLSAKNEKSLLTTLDDQGDYIGKWAEQLFEGS